VRSYLAVPVISRSGEVLGGLFFGHANLGVFTERSERILTVIVLIIATIQIVVSRPRPRSDSQAQRNAAASTGSVTAADRPGTLEANSAPPKAN